MIKRNRAARSRVRLRHEQESPQDEADPEEMADGWVEVVEDAMQPAVGVWVKEE